MTDIPALSRDQYVSLCIEVMVIGATLCALALTAILFGWALMSVDAPMSLRDSSLVFVALLGLCVVVAFLAAVVSVPLALATGAVVWRVTARMALRSRLWITAVAWGLASALQLWVPHLIWPEANSLVLSLALIAAIMVPFATLFGGAFARRRFDAIQNRIA